MLFWFFNQELFTPDSKKIWCSVLPPKDGPQNVDHCRTHILTFQKYRQGFLAWKLKNLFTYFLTANIFESGQMPTPWKFLDSSPVVPLSKILAVKMLVTQYILKKCVENKKNCILWSKKYDNYLSPWQRHWMDFSPFSNSLQTKN